MADKQLWFRAKKYGWGWVPATKQGWFACLGYVALILLGSLFLLPDKPDTFGSVVIYLIWVMGCTLIFLYLSYKYGQKPKWRWGGKDESE